MICRMYFILSFIILSVNENVAQVADKCLVWHTTEMTDSCDAHYLFVMSDGYFSKTRYRTDNGGFISTKGGKYELFNDSIRFYYEFDSYEPNKVSLISTYFYNVQGDQLFLKSKRKSRVLDRYDYKPNSELKGTYLFSGSKKDEEITRRSPDLPRKTMKILTGSRFQWVAYNTETKEFLGTGGGTYTAENGSYIEKIEFFSKNNKRVGAVLPFEFNKQGDDWHHTGLSSGGSPIYEIWTIRKN